MAKYVPTKTFIFDDTVKKNEVPYVFTYNPLPLRQEEIDSLNSIDTGRKIPFFITLAGAFAICAIIWVGIAFAIIKLASHG